MNDENIERKPEPEITCISKPAMMADDSNNGTYRYGFERGLEAEKILGKYCCFQVEKSIDFDLNCIVYIGAKMEGDELKFLFKWKNCTEGEFVPAKIANVLFPQLVIQFYEGITFWAWQRSRKESFNSRLNELIDFKT